MKNAIPFLLLLVLVAFGGYVLITSLQEEASRTLQPYQQANEALQTQVSVLMNPTPTIIPDPVTYINEIRALARLETIQYSVEKVITAEDPRTSTSFGFLLGDRLLFVAHGYVIAGIDLAKLNPEDMRLENGVLYVSLPQAEVFVATLNNEKSYVYSRDTGLLNKGVVDLETLARQAAEQEILRAALEDGILEQAQRNANIFMEGFFENLGYDTVVIETKAP